MNRMFDMELLQIRLVSWSMIALLLGLLAFLWDLQVVQGNDPLREIDKQSIRRVRLPERRGRIIDRNGAIYADNRPSHHIGIFIEELRQPGSTTTTLNRVMAVIEELSWRMQVPCPVKRSDVKKHWNAKLYQPFPIWSDVDDEMLARWAEACAGMRGVDVYTEAKRVYPFDDSACHVLGRVVPMARDASREEQHFDSYIEGMTGRGGIEQLFNKELSGTPGGQLVRVDVYGYRHGIVGKTLEPTTGRDIQLSLDARIQRLAEHVLGNEKGAVVVMDPRNGEVLALASFPRFDVNRYRELFNVYRRDVRKPFLNRATHEYFPPGSTFKPVVALAGLESGRAHEGTRYFCPGKFRIGNRTIHCANRSGHGDINMRQSLERSCNVYYFHLGLDVGYPYLYRMAEELGLGQKTGVEVLREKPGVLPNSAWKRQKHGFGWTDGDTCNVSIGQGFLTVTPLQMCNITAAIANGGTLFRPRLVRAIGTETPGIMERTRPEVLRRIAWSPQALRLVQSGMFEVVQGARGTARNSAIPGFPYAAKTGTAQFGRPGRYHCWTIAFAPYEAPRYAVALVVQDTPEMSSVAAAPKMKMLFKGIRALEEME